jgi:predicted RNA binding protein YcfA (HicA-like mRNA interferase family)
MKRVDLIRAIEAMGCDFIRHGGKHDWYQNPRTKVSQAVPRHREIKERRLARSWRNCPIRMMISRAMMMSKRLDALSL